MKLSRWKIVALTLASAWPTVNTALAVSIPTSFGSGADAEIANDEPAIDPVTGQPNTANQAFGDSARGLLNQTGVRMQIDPLFSTIIRHRVTVLRFDLTGITGDLSDAYLQVHSTTQGRFVDVLALNDSAETGVENWEEAAIMYNTAPGFLDLEPLPTSYVALDPAKVTSIGRWSIPGPSSAGPVSTTIIESRVQPPEGPEAGHAYDATILPEFNISLSSAVAADTNNLLTLYITRDDATNPAYTGHNGNLVLLTKEGLAADQALETPVGFSIAPTLVLPHATILTPGGLVGDYNGDNLVDAADYTVWRDNVGGETLANRDSVLSGPIGQLDYDAWKANFGQSAGSGGLTLVSAAPEASTGLLAAVVSAVGLLLSRPGRWTAARKYPR